MVAEMPTIAPMVPNMSYSSPMVADMPAEEPMLTAIPVLQSATSSPADGPVAHGLVWVYVTEFAMDPPLAHFAVAEMWEDGGTITEKL